MIMEIKNLLDDMHISDHVKQVISDNYLYYLLDEESIKANIKQDITSIYSDWVYVDELAKVGAKLIVENREEGITCMYNHYASIATVDMLGKSMVEKMKPREELNVLEIAVVAIYFTIYKERNE